jgi:uncharacterized protein
MKIDLTELLREIGAEADIEEEEKVSFPEDGLTLTRPVKVKLHLTNTGPSVLVNAKIETEVALVCSRCLESFRIPLACRVDEEFSLHPPAPTAGKKKEFELKEKDFVYPVGKDNILDLDEVVRQNLILALPIKPLCQQNCEGG